MKHIKKINEYQTLKDGKPWFDNDDERKQYVTKNFFDKIDSSIGNIMEEFEIAFNRAKYLSEEDKIKAIERIEKLYKYIKNEMK